MRVGCWTTSCCMDERDGSDARAAVRSEAVSAAVGHRRAARQTAAVESGRIMLMKRPSRFMGLGTELGFTQIKTWPSEISRASAAVSWTQWRTTHGGIPDIDGWTPPSWISPMATKHQSGEALAPGHRCKCPLVVVQHESAFRCGELVCKHHGFPSWWDFKIAFLEKFGTDRKREASRKYVSLPPNVCP